MILSIESSPNPLAISAIACSNVPSAQTSAKNPIPFAAGHTTSFLGDNILLFGKPSILLPLLVKSMFTHPDDEQSAVTTPSSDLDTKPQLA